jgi:hypothetical protein
LTDSIDSDILVLLTNEEKVELDRLLAPMGSDSMAKYRYDPVGFIHDVVRWGDQAGPAPYQDEILAAVVKHRRVCVRAPHGVGKTAVAALLLLWFVLTSQGLDWKVATTASVWRQLKQFLWPEIHKWARAINWLKMNRYPFRPSFEMQTMGIKLATGEAFAMASDNPAQLEGAHADRLLVIFDESKTIPPATWDAVEGAFSTGDAYWLSISTPGDTVGRFYEIHSKKQGLTDWWTRHITVEEAIAAGRISRDWVEARRVQWGENSPVFQNRVLGEFATFSDVGVIPLAWVELANQRWLDWEDSGKPGDFVCIGVDVARYGSDKTVFAPRFGNAIDTLMKYSKMDTMETAGKVVAYIRVHGGYANVDVVGVGAGVYDRVAEQKVLVYPFSAADRYEGTDTSGQLEFMNTRSAAWWCMRELLDPSSGANIALPLDDALTGDLVSLQWKTTSTGKIAMESKDDLIKRLGRSPDDGDAVIMAFFKPSQSATGWLEALSRERAKREEATAVGEQRTR